MHYFFVVRPSKCNGPVARRLAQFQSPIISEKDLWENFVPIWYFVCVSSLNLQQCSSRRIPPLIAIASILIFCCTAHRSLQNTLTVVKLFIKPLPNHINIIGVFVLILSGLGSHSVAEGLINWHVWALAIFIQAPPGLITPNRRISR